MLLFYYLIEQQKIFFGSALPVLRCEFCKGYVSFTIIELLHVSSRVVMD